MNRRIPTASRDDYTDEPIYWFALLDKAVEQGDHEAATEAQRRARAVGSPRPLWSAPTGSPH